MLGSKRRAKASKQGKNTSCPVCHPDDRTAHCFSSPLVCKGEHGRHCRIRKQPHSPLISTKVVHTATTAYGLPIEAKDIMQDQVQQLGPWGPAAFILAVVCAEMIPLFPTQPLALSSGLLFGAQEVVQLSYTYTDHTICIQLLSICPGSIYIFVCMRSNSCIRQVLVCCRAPCVQSFPQPWPRQ